MTVTEAVKLSGLTPSAAYTGVETTDDFLLAVQTEASQTDVKNWVVCADHVREHSGALNASTTDNTYIRTGKGEKGEGALILTSDVGGSAGANATFAADFKGIGTPAEFDYNTAVAG